jgi:hypothetical protein
MNDLTLIPSLNELESQFPYDPTTDPAGQTIQTDLFGQKDSPEVISFDGVTVIELYDWTAFTKFSETDIYPTMHFNGKTYIDGRALTYLTGPLGEYDAVNDWWPVSHLDCTSCHDSIPFRLIGERITNPEKDIRFVENSTTVDVEDPREHKLPHPSTIFHDIPPPR